MAKRKFSYSKYLNKNTDGVAVPVLSNYYVSDLKPTAQLLGTVNNNRGRWNPFLPDNNMIKKKNIYYKELELKAKGGRHQDGIYAFRFTTYQCPHNVHKADHNQIDSEGKPKLVSGFEGRRGQNIIIKIEQDGLYKISFDPEKSTFDITPKPIYLTEIESVQINGFVWDNENMFQKFDETRTSHNMTQNGDWWEITIPLKVDGGIDFRHDGVYQFLFSVNHNEDWGFAARNNGGNTLYGGAGFGSSGGESQHSAITIQVYQNGDYTLRMNPKTYEFEVIPPEGLQTPKIWNEISSFQLLGTFYGSDQFNPTNPHRNMTCNEGGLWSKVVNLQPGVYAANFALSRELFLDTMALGAWLESDKLNQLIGSAWHGKPNEPNIFFEVLVGGKYEFCYDLEGDKFFIEYREENKEKTLAIIPKITLDTLQLVGNFDPPLEPWNPSSPANNMDRVGNNIFTKTVTLEANKTYEYKYTANNWSWLWVFADYELDGYGTDFSGSNPDPLHSRLEDLKTYGQLTTHGNPPSLQFTPTVSGQYTFTVNLETGAYNVKRFEG